MINRLYIPSHSYQKYINCSHNHFGIHPESCQPAPPPTNSLFFLPVFLVSMDVTSPPQLWWSATTPPHPLPHLSSPCCLFFLSSKELQPASGSSSERLCFGNGISYLCSPSPQLASICRRLGLANSGATSRQLEKLAANKFSQPLPASSAWSGGPHSI